MYAIRSYYGYLAQFGWDYPFAIYLLPLLFLPLLLKALYEPKRLHLHSDTVEAVPPKLRITSYNVCYTKLLRFETAQLRHILLGSRKNK